MYPCPVQMRFITSFITSSPSWHNTALCSSRGQCEGIFKTAGCWCVPDQDYVNCFCSILVYSVGLVYVSNISLSSHCSMQDGFMKSCQTQRTMWATDWPVTRMTTPSPTLLPSTPLSRFCPNTLTTHSRPPRPPAAAAAPPRLKTPSPLLHTPPQPSLNTRQYRVCLLHPREWRRTLFPKSSMFELCHKLSPIRWLQMKQPDSNPNISQKGVFV